MADLKDSAAEKNNNQPLELQGYVFTIEILSSSNNKRAPAGEQASNGCVLAPAAANASGGTDNDEGDDSAAQQPVSEGTAGGCCAGDSKSSDSEGDPMLVITATEKATEVRYRALVRAADLSGGQYITIDMVANLLRDALFKPDADADQDGDGADEAAAAAAQRERQAKYQTSFATREQAHDLDNDDTKQLAVIWRTQHWNFPFKFDLHVIPEDASKRHDRLIRRLAQAATDSEGLLRATKHVCTACAEALDDQETACTEGRDALRDELRRAREELQQYAIDAAEALRVEHVTPLQQDVKTVQQTTTEQGASLRALTAKVTPLDAKVTAHETTLADHKRVADAKAVEIKACTDKLVPTITPAPALAAGWSASNPLVITLVARRASLNGTLVNAGAAQPPPGAIFTLPLGYRPPAVRTFPVVANNAFGVVQVGADGAVQLLLGNASVGVHLDNVQFVVAA